MVCRSFHRLALAASLIAAAWPARAAEPAAAIVAEADLAVASAVQIVEEGAETRFVVNLDKKPGFRAFVLADPNRVVIDLSQVHFGLPTEFETTPRGLIKAFRYGLVMPGSSRIVLDLAGPARIDGTVLEESGQGVRLVVKLSAIDAASFASAVTQAAPDSKPVPDMATASLPGPSKARPSGVDRRPVVVIDPGHGGIDNGTQSGGEAEKSLVLGFALTLRDRIESGGKFRVVMTRSDDTFIPLGDRVKIARTHNAALFLSIHADALPRRDGDAQGATVYTLSDKASDTEAQRLADLENKSDAIGGVNLTEEPTDVADILIDLAQRETRNFSNRFARILIGEMKSAARMHKRPLKSAGFKVLKAPDVPSVLIELGYVSNKGDLQQLVSTEWRTRTVGAVNQAVEAFFNKRLVSVRPEN